MRRASARSASCSRPSGCSSLVSVHGGWLGYEQRQEPKQIRRPWSSPIVRTRLAGQCHSSSRGGHTRAPSSATSYSVVPATGRPGRSTIAKWWPSISNVRSAALAPCVGAHTWTSQAASASTQTLARSRPTWRSKGPRTRPGASGLPLLERGHGQPRLAQLLPVQLGRLAVAAPHDGQARGVDALGDRVALVDVDAGDVARERERHVVERVVVVVADDDPPLAAEGGARVLYARELGGLAHGPGRYPFRSRRRRSTRPSVATMPATTRGARRRLAMTGPTTPTSGNASPSSSPAAGAGRGGASAAGGGPGAAVVAGSGSGAAPSAAAASAGPSAAAAASPPPDSIASRLSENVSMMRAETSSMMPRPIEATRPLSLTSEVIVPCVELPFSRRAISTSACAVPWPRASLARARICAVWASASRSTISTVPR